MRDNDTVIKEAFESPEWYLTSTAYNIRIRCETIREFLQGRRYENVLDIGCGDGSLSLQLLDGHNRLTLLDRSQTMLGRAVSRVPEQLAASISVINDDFMAAEPNTGPYDLVICVGVLAYVKEPFDFLRKIASVLAPGGTLILECTDGAHFVSRFCRAYVAVRRLWSGDALFITANRSSRTVLGVAGECGFVLRESFRYSLPLAGLRKFVSQKVSYAGIRTVFGSARRNGVPWLGNECLFCLELSEAGKMVTEVEPFAR